MGRRRAHRRFRASLGTLSFASANAGNVSVTAAGEIAIDMSVGAGPSILDGIGSLNEGSGNAGDVALLANSLNIRNSATISGETFGAGSTGNVSVNVSGPVSIDGSGGPLDMITTGISALPFGTGGSGGVTISTTPFGSISLDKSAVLAGSNGGGEGGPISLTTGQLKLTNGAAVASSIGRRKRRPNYCESQLGCDRWEGEPGRRDWDWVPNGADDPEHPDEWNWNRGRSGGRCRCRGANDTWQWPDR